MKTKTKVNGKKGSTFDMLIAIPILFAAGIAFLIAANFWDTIYNNSPLKGSNPTTKMYLDNFNSYTLWTFDYILIMAFIGFFVGALILAAFARHHPVLAWFNILVIIVLVIISVNLSNSYEQIVNKTQLAATSSTISVFNFLMQNLGMISIVFGAFLIIFMFGFKSEVQPI